MTQAPGFINLPSAAGAGRACAVGRQVRTRTRPRQGEPPAERRSAAADAAEKPEAPAPALSGGAPSGGALAGLRALGATVAWLSGSIAGIGAIFYALGYLATLANLHLLGLDFLAVRYEPTFYIQRGAGFLLLSGMDIGQFWFGLFVAAALGVLGWRLAAGRGWSPARRQPWRSFALHKGAWATAAYLALLVLLALQLRAHFLFPEDLAVSGVLYPAAEGAGAGSPIREWILSGQNDRLQDRYAIFVNQQVVIGVLLLLAWALNRAWRWGALLTAPFAVVFAISLAWLPLEYGKLALANKFPQAVIRLDRPAEPAAAQPALTYLLNKTDSEFVLWDAQRRKIIWVPSRAVASAEIFESRTLSQIVKSSGEASR